MDKKELHARLLEIVTPLCQAQNLEVWGLELLFGAGGGQKIVRLYLDSAQGVGIDECAYVSQRLSLALDVEDIIPGSFTLEVSSPGLERQFFSLDQMRPYVGRTVRVRLRKALETRKNFKARLLALTSTAFTLEDDDQTVTIAWEDVGKANLVYEYECQGKPGNDKSCTSGKPARRSERRS